MNFSFEQQNFHKMADELYLEIFPGDFGLPSLDPECLITVVYCSLANIPIKIVEKTNLLFAKLPALKTENVTISGALKIIEYFETMNFNSDFVKYSRARKMDIWSYQVMVENKLSPCYQYLFWFDNDNYNEFLRAWYASRLPFPTNFFVPRLMRRQAISTMESLIPSKIMECDSKSTLIENHVLADAKHCLNLLNEKLSDNKYFFGDIPTLFDAMAFTYLVLLSKVPIKNELIKIHINETSTLCNYYQRIMHKLSQSSTSKTYSTSPFEQQEENEQTVGIKWKNVFSSALFASLFMIFYAFSNGIINGSDDDEDEYEEEIDQIQDE